jgi:CzcA family heavy metal efflux pump
MWIVRIALAHPYTFIVLAILLLIIGPLAIIRTPTDIFPSIDIPVVSVVWSYTGMPPKDMGQLITATFERALTTTVNDIEHIESESLIGVSVTKIFFQPSVKIDMAVAQVTAISQTLLKFLPPGITPPLILSYNASTVPVIQLVLSSPILSEQTINDLSTNFIRTQLASVEGAALPFPYGGKTRQIQADLNQQAMQTYGVSPQQVSAAINAQNLIIPAGTQKIGQYEYIVKLNASPQVVDELNQLPIRTENGGVLYVRDVAHVRDGSPPQTNIVRVNGIRAVMMSIQKTGGASTLKIIDQIKELLPAIRESLPPSLKISAFADQSLFVIAAIRGVILESIAAAMLTCLMILLFLGSLKSTFIISLSIPLSMLASICVMSALGQTLNIMTLGGLALAVGILVDDATVAIENINWNLGQGKKIDQAILDSAQQIAVPALVSTLSICIVFIPMFFLPGVSHYLFIPLAMAVVFAMLASYLLSRTLVVTLAKYLLHPSEKQQEQPRKRMSAFSSIHHAFISQFEKMREKYRHTLAKVLEIKHKFILIFLIVIGASILLLFPFLGSDFFPTVDAGQIKLHLLAPIGTRVEETAKLVDEIDHEIHRIIPPRDLESIVDNVGLPISGINLSYSNSATVGPEDADILISLKSGHKPTLTYVKQLRTQLSEQFPGVSFSFLPADIVNQILNFGLPSPINIQITGTKEIENYQYAKMLLQRIKQIPGVSDARLRQAYNYPQLDVHVDRSFARELGFTQNDVASSLLISLSGSFQTAPTFWLDPKNGTSYPIATQTPQYSLNSLQALRNIPVVVDGYSSQILGALGTITRSFGPVVVSHYNVLPVIDIFASVQDRDLGSVSHAIKKLITQMKKDLPKSSKVLIGGQMKTQSEAFSNLYAGLIFSMVLVYLLIVVNFQSWTDPFVIIMALPAAFAGIVWMLFLTHTTISVPALTGAIMCMGVATANSILLISFIRQNIAEGKKLVEAIIEAASTRLRPILMTAFAMIIGMLPMSLGLGEGGEQNAPLGRAVIGGLTFATIATLFFVPAVYCFIQEVRNKKLVKEKIYG